jgi:alkylated DNA repair dioxygenase AlkB
MARRSSLRTVAATADLFAPAPLPRGLEYHAQFLVRDEEAALLHVFAGLPFHAAKFQQYTARRRVVGYGGIPDGDIPQWIGGDALPPWLAQLRHKVAAWRGVRDEIFVHALVTEYQPGTPIGWHRDKPKYGMVIGISLASACRMRFRPYANQKDRGAVIALELAPRSLYVLQDDIRWHWQHSIPPTGALRYSVTFRTAA